MELDQPDTSIMDALAASPTTTLVNTFGRYFLPQIENSSEENNHPDAHTYSPDLATTNIAAPVAENYHDTNQYYCDSNQTPQYQYYEQGNSNSCINSSTPYTFNYQQHQQAEYWPGQPWMADSNPRMDAANFYFIDPAAAETASPTVASATGTEMIEPIKLSLYESNNGQYCMQYDCVPANSTTQAHESYNTYDNNNINNVHYDPCSYYNTQQHHDFMNMLRTKIRNNELDKFCHICNYGFKSYPRLIRHMETKRHAIQIERFRMMNIKGNGNNTTQQLRTQQQPPLWYSSNSNCDDKHKSNVLLHDNVNLNTDTTIISTTTPTITMPVTTTTIDTLPETDIQLILDSFINELDEFDNHIDIFDDIPEYDWSGISDVL